MKKVILFIVDSLHPIVLERTISEGTAPALNYLAKKGKYWPSVVSSFPTMTPVATSSIMTGQWSDQHLVPGFIWYNEETDQIVDYGATWQTVIKLSPEKIVRNLLQRLNNEHLNPQSLTMHEKLEQNGFATGNINFFIHRASNSYLAKIPSIISFFTRFRMYKEKVMGPRFLALGQFIHPSLVEGSFRFPRGILHRFGFNDVFSGNMAAKIIKEGHQPDFLVVYLPDNDKYSHQYGPLRTGPSIERVDQQIALVMDSFGSWEKAVEENVIIVTGDHSQTTVGLGNEFQIDLDHALRGFRRLKSTDKINQDKEIAICPNERMAFVYILRRKKEILPEVVGILARDRRNDQIAWRISKNNYCVMQGGSEKKLYFSKKGPYTDHFGESWDFEGDLSVVDATVTPEQVLEFGNYPDAFSRLSAALDTRKGSKVIISAASGYEYFGDGAPIHPGGGSHGSLELEDSIVPMIISGMTSSLEHLRIIDLFPMISQHFQLDGSSS